MSDSVAGKIRIDLLANVAQFKAGLREAGREGLGSFREEFERTSRSFNTQKAFSARMDVAKDSWKGAMDEVRKERLDYLRGSGATRQQLAAENLRFQGLMRQEWMPHDPAVQRSIRLKSMLPWGMSTRTELTREAALTAAAIADGKQTIVKQLAAASREIAGSAASAGGLSGLLGFMGGHPLITAGAVSAGLIVKQIHDRAGLARDVYRTSLRLGQGSEDTSRLLALGFDENQNQLTKFQQSVAGRSEGFKRLGLSPERLAAQPLTRALLDMSAALENVKNPAERARLAIELFGRGGGETLATLTNLRERMDAVGSASIIRAEEIERVKAWDTALKGARNTLSEISFSIGKAFGSQSGIGTHMARAFESMPYWVDIMQDAVRLGDEEISKRLQKYDAMERRWKKEDFNIEHAEEIEKARVAQAKLTEDTKRYAEALQDAQDQLITIRDRILDLQGGEGAATREKYKQKLVESGLSLSSPEIFDRMRHYDDMIDLERDWKKYREDEKKRESLTESSRTPLQKYRDEMAELDRLYAGRADREAEYNRLARRYLEDYYREAAGLDAKRLQEELKTPLQKFREEMAWLRDMASSGAVGQDLAAGIGEKRLTDLRKGIGISDPLGDYRKALKDLNELYRMDRSITPEQYERRHQELRKQTIRGMAEDQPSISLVPAMQAGSREAYSVIAQSMVTDPKVVEAQKTNVKLDAIDKKLGVIAAAAAAGGNPLNIF
jgi:hypothetical protein